MDKKSLIERLQNGDGDVMFVPFGFKTGEQSSRELERNHYIIARYGEEGASKIAEISDKFKYNPNLWSFNSVDEEKVRASALNRGWILVGRLLVDGNYLGYYNGGRSFGVLDSEKE